MGTNPGHVDPHEGMALPVVPVTRVRRAITSHKGAAKWVTRLPVSMISNTPVRYAY
jgi:hypothetical protein